VKSIDPHFGINPIVIICHTDADSGRLENLPAAESANPRRQRNAGQIQRFIVRILETAPCFHFVFTSQ
jgi:hypothetical protein